MYVVFLWGNLRRVKKQIIHILQKSRTFRELYIVQISLQDLQEIRRIPSKILRNYCPGSWFFFPREGMKVLTYFIKLKLKDALHKSVTVKSLLLVGMDVSNIWGFETTGCWGMTMCLLLRGPGQTSTLSLYVFSPVKWECYRG